MAAELEEIAKIARIAGIAKIESQNQTFHHGDTESHGGALTRKINRKIKFNSKTSPHTTTDEKSRARRETKKIRNPGDFGSFGNSGNDLSYNPRLTT